MVQNFDASDVIDTFPKNVEGSPDALLPAFVDLDERDSLEMRIGPARNSISSDEIRMLALHGLILGRGLRRYLPG